MKTRLLLSLYLPLLPLETLRPSGLEEMQRWMAVPDHFSAHVETFDRIGQAKALMHGTIRVR